MIEVYESTNTDFTRNGDMTLLPLTCVLYAKINGEIRVELTHQYDELGRWKYLTEENVIACPTPWGRQLFRIYKKTKNMTKITAYASHIMYDLRNKMLIDVRPTDKDGQAALDILLSGTKYTGHSDIKTISTAYYERKNIINALVGDIDQSFINRWGGEILPDNFDIYINDKIGKNRGVCIEFGKNLVGVEETIDMSDVVTRIIPVGYNGVMLSSAEPWVDSPNIGKYAQIYENEVKYEDVKLKEGDGEGYETQEEVEEALKAAAKKDFEDGADKPKVNYVVNMALIENTDQYKKYKVLETVQMGDTVGCRVSKIGLDVEARCLDIEYDCIREKMQKIELGEYVKTYFDEQRETNKKVSTLANGAENAYDKEETNKKIKEYLESYATEGYVDKKIEETEVKCVTKDNLRETLKDYNTKTEEKELLKDYVTKEVYEQKIQELEGKIEELQNQGSGNV